MNFFVCFLLVLLVFCIILISIYNSLVSSHKKVERSSSLIDIYLKKRFDLIPNLVECVKTYSKHEKETLQEIVKLRNSFEETGSYDDRTKLNAYYNKCISLVEQYPDLKASELYLNLQNELSKVESEIEAARRIYSTDVTKYNTKIQTFPTNLMAYLLDYEPIEPLSFDTKEIKIEF